MTTSTIWRRPDLRLPDVFDTLFFDVGVLIQTIHSFRATNLLVTEYVVGQLQQGLDWGQEDGKALVTMADVEAFRQAGGYNDEKE